MTAHAAPHSVAHRFVRELLETGLAMTDALATLIESLEERDPWPGEDSGEVLLEMAAGSIRPVLAKAGDEAAEQAAELIAAARERFFADLRLAAELSARRPRGGG
jgi:hypothetical protein